MNRDAVRPKHPTRPGLCALVLLGLSVSGTAQGAHVSSSGWRESLAHSGLGDVKAQSVTASATATTDLTQAAPLSVPEPAATASFLAAQTARRDLAPARYDANHPVLGPLLGEEKLLNAGNTANASTFNGLLPNNPFYNFYRWKRSLDPTRFDANHPRIGAMLAEDQRVRNLIAAATTQSQAQFLIPAAAAGAGAHVSALGTGSGGIQAAQLSAVPEPTSLALVLLGAGALLAPRLAKRLRSQRDRDPRR